MDASVVSPITQAGAGDGPVAPLDIPRVIRRGLRLIRARPFSVLAASLLLNGAPQAMLAWLQVEPYTGRLARAGITLAFTIAMSGLGALYVAWLALQLADDGSARPGSSFPSMRRMLVAAPAVFAAGMISCVATIGASILLLVPGLMVAVAWSVAAPALAVERLGPLAALSRSADLTRGNRWRIFGLMAIALVFLAVLGALAIMPFGKQTVPLLGAIVTLSSITVIPLVSAVSRALINALLASIYVEVTRHDRSTALAEVFT